MELGFPLGIRLTHAFNIVFLTLLIRSGIEILSGHPMLYFKRSLPTEQRVDPLHKQANVSKSALDCRGREAAIHTVAGTSG
jgi:hypothetical protein